MANNADDASAIRAQPPRTNSLQPYVPGLIVYCPQTNRSNYCVQFFSCLVAVMTNLLFLILASLTYFFPCSLSSVNVYRNESPIYLHAINATKHPSPPIAASPLGDQSYTCNTGPYALHMSEANCRDALLNGMPELVNTTIGSWGNRSQGTFDYNLPQRYISGEQE